jgi:type VI secretion system protein ImpF
MARTISHSLIDRLLDDDPDEAIERAEDEETALERYKVSMRRDLEQLLNTKRPLLDGLDRHEDLNKTVIGYGIHDLSTEDMSVPAVRDRMRRKIVQVIRDHETRLSNIEVEVDEGPTSSGMNLRISALLSLTRNREMVVYEANVKPGDRIIAVKLSS